MAVIFITPPEMAQYLAKSAREKRLSLNLSQQSLAERSGISLSVIKKFERTGNISLKSLLKLALTLGSLDNFTDIFKQITPATLPTLDSLMCQKKRKRGRK